MDDELERHRQWFERYVAAVEQGVREPARTGVRYSCPCCGFPTLSERGGDEICELCNWEDDGQDDPHAEEIWGGPNGRYSLAAARLNFKRHLIMYDTADPSMDIGGRSNTAAEHEAKQAMIEAFEAMAKTREPQALENLWKRVGDSRKALRLESERRVAEYERKMKS